MNWITNYVRPTINSLFSRREVPDNLWTKCGECGTMLFHRELADNLNVCTSCDHHMPIRARDRLASLFDGGVFVEVKVPEPITDPLQFRDHAQQLGLRQFRQWRSAVIPLSTGGLAVAGGILWLNNGTSLAHSLYASSFMALAVLVVPHMLVPLVMAHLQTQQARRLRAVLSPVLLR